MSSSMLNAAHSAHLLSVEKAKKNDMDREPEYQERNWTRIREGQERAQRTIDARIDKALLALGDGPRRRRCPPTSGSPASTSWSGSRPAWRRPTPTRRSPTTSDKLLAGTKMADKDFRLGLLDKTTAEIAATKDPMVDLALALDPLYQQNREAAKRRQGADDAPPAALHAGPPRASRAASSPPDANSTLRVTFGTVKGKPAAGRASTWTAFTTLKGIEQKAHRRGRVRRPGARARGDQGPAGRQADAVRPPGDRRRAGRLPLDGRHDRRQLRARRPSTARASSSACSSTAPTTRSRPTSSTTPVNTRSIHADVRYMLWVMSEVDGASHLIREMGVK